MGTDDVKLLTEYFDDKFAAVLENVETIVDRKVRSIVQEELDTKLNPIKTDLKVIKAAVTDTNAQVQNHERRIAILENA